VRPRGSGARDPQDVPKSCRSRVRLDVLKATQSDARNQLLPPDRHRPRSGADEVFITFLNRSGVLFRYPALTLCDEVLR